MLRASAMGFRAAAVARRALSSKAPALSAEQAISSSKLILNEIESPSVIQALWGAQSGNKLQKWQTANAVLIQSMLKVLPQVGFSADAQGLQRYTEAFAVQARSDDPVVRKTLGAVNTERWRVLLINGYGCEPAPTLPLDDARKLAIDIVDALQDPALLNQVEQSRTGLNARLSDQEHQTLVAGAVLSVQADVMERHGFKGDGGYAQAQVCLMEHAFDAVVNASVSAATNALYIRAGINLQQLMSGGTE